MAPSMHTTYPVPRTNQKVLDAHPRPGRVLFHLIGLGMMISGFQGLNGIAAGKVIGQSNQYGGFLQYLTIIGLFTTMFFLVLSAFQDLLPNVTVFRTVRRIVLLFSLPVEVVISSIYWSLVTIKPDLMFPPLPDSVKGGSEPSSSGDATLLFRIPFWMDFSMHLLPALTLIGHFFFLEPKFKPPASTYGASALAVSFGFLYSIWVEHCATKNGRFPYPFLNIMDGISRGVFYTLSTLLALGTFWIMNRLHR